MNNESNKKTTTKTPQLDGFSIFYEETRAPRYASEHKSNDTTDDISSTRELRRVKKIEDTTTQ